MVTKVVEPVMNLKPIIVSVSLFAFSAGIVNAQQHHHLVKKADHYFKHRMTKKAEEAYREVLKVEPNNYHAIRRIARCYWYLHDVDEAVKWYEAAIQANPDGNDTTYFDLGLAYKRKEMYAEAKEQFQTFLGRYTAQDHFREQAEEEIQGCDYAIVAKKEDPKYMVTEVSGPNSESGDFNPMIFSVKGDTFMVFTSHRSDSKGKVHFAENGEGKYSDLFIAKMENDSAFGKPETLSKKVNTKANDGNGFVTADGKFLYYTVCGGGKYGKHHGCSIFMSEFNQDTKKWSKGVKLEGVNGTREVKINSRGKTKKVPTYDAQPTLSADGNLMYFVSDREGGIGGLDIWYSQKNGNAWSTPSNAGNVINTYFSEVHPSLGKDGKTLYFSSDGMLGFGGYDIYKSEGSLSTWSKPTDLGTYVNSSWDDFSVNWTFQDSIGYFASNRQGGKGSDDIYLMKWIYRPPIELAVHGTIRDKGTKQIIPFATAILFKIVDGGSLVPVDTFATDQSGAYKFPLEKQSDYKIVGNAPEYLANEEMITTKDLKQSTDLEKDIDIFLDRIVIGRPIVLQNIYYDFDKFNLRTESVAELDKLIKILNDNPNISIQIGSHTDTNGSEKYNIKLSNNRAKSVMEYLTKNGIEKDRLDSMGYGESMPMVYPELSDEDEQANRRTEFRINSMNYQPKKK